jgi:hypothetical protein
VADVFGAFQQGAQLADAESAHAQQLQENKLRTMVLRHELDRMKTEDALREYEIKQRHAELQFGAQQGQPAASFPPKPTTIPTAPSGSVAPGVDLPQASGVGPEVVPTRGPQPVQFPGLPQELGGGEGYSRTPNTLEELVAERKRAELEKAMYTKFDTGQVMPALGPTPPAGPKLQGVPIGGLADNAGNIVVPGPGRAPQRPIVAPDGTIRDAANPSKVLARTGPPQARAENPGVAADRAARMAERQAQLIETELRKQHSETVANGWKTHNEAFKKWNDPTYQLDHPGEEAPAYQPPSFEEWLNTPEGQQATTGATKRLIPSTKGSAGAGAAGGATPKAAPKEGQVAPVPGHPGAEQTFIKGKWVQTK